MQRSARCGAWQWADWRRPRECLSLRNHQGGDSRRARFRVAQRSQLGENTEFGKNSTLRFPPRAKRWERSPSRPSAPAIARPGWPPGARPDVAASGWSTRTTAPQSNRPAHGAADQRAGRLERTKAPFVHKGSFAQRLSVLFFPNSAGAPLWPRRPRPAPPDRPGQGIT